MRDVNNVLKGACEPLVSTDVDATIWRILLGKIAMQKIGNSA